MPHINTHRSCVDADLDGRGRSACRQHDAITAIKPGDIIHSRHGRQNALGTVYTLICILQAPTPIRSNPPLQHSPARSAAAKLQKHMHVNNYESKANSKLPNSRRRNHPPRRGHHLHLCHRAALHSHGTARRRRGVWDLIEIPNPRHRSLWEAAERRREFRDPIEFLHLRHLSFLHHMKATEQREECEFLFDSKNKSKMA